MKVMTGDNPLLLYSQGIYEVIKIPVVRLFCRAFIFRLTVSIFAPESMTIAIPLLEKSDSAISSQMMIWRFLRGSDPLFFLS